MKVQYKQHKHTKFHHPDLSALTKKLYFTKSSPMSDFNTVYSRTRKSIQPSTTDIHIYFKVQINQEPCLVAIRPAPFDLSITMYKKYIHCIAGEFHTGTGSCSDKQEVLDIINDPNFLDCNEEQEFQYSLIVDNVQMYKTVIRMNKELIVLQEQNKLSFSTMYPVLLKYCDIPKE